MVPVFGTERRNPMNAPEGPPEKRTLADSQGSEESMKKNFVPTSTTENQVRKLPPGAHPGFDHLKSQAGVYRCRLRPVVRKRDPKHADYVGTLPIANGKARVFLWVHKDGSLGIRVQRMDERKERGQT
jgi:hypothetical protein